MSSEGENTKNISSEGEEKNNPEDKDKSEKMEVDNEDKENGKTENGESEGKSKENAQENESKDKPSGDMKDEEKDEDEKKPEKKVNKIQKAVENDTKSEDTSEKEEEEEEEDENEKDEKSVPLLDQPLEMSGTRERKKVQRFNDNLAKEAKEGGKLEVPTGKGIALGEIPRIDASISRFKNDDLKLLHRLLFKTPGKTAMIKKNIKKFNGFDFAKDSEEYGRKLSSTQKFEVKQLKSICEMLDLDKKGNKEEISERIIEYLLEPKDSGKPVGGGRPKRTAAVKANNRGYSSHDDSYSSDEKPSPRGRRDKGKRPNLKEESSSESDEEFRPSDASEEKPPVNKRKRRSKKAAQSDEEEVSEVEESVASSEETDDEPKNKKRKVAANSKVTKPKGTPGRRGRKPAATPASAKKKTPAKKGKKPAQNSSEESEHQEDGSSSEDEPLVKKPKNPQPPTDDEIKSYVKDILEGANLEEITMKTVCKQVYAHYPDFDLTHKKEYIKTTVKSLIST